MKTATITKRGQDNWSAPAKQTIWQRERERGRIHPITPERGLWARIFRR